MSLNHLKFKFVNPIPQQDDLIPQHTQQSSLQSQLYVNNQQSFDSQYHQYFQDVKHQIKKIETIPKQKLLQYKIKILKQTQLKNYHLKFKYPNITIKYHQKSASIVTYNVIIGYFQLEIILLNINAVKPMAKNDKYILGVGSFGEIRIQSSTKKKFAVKCQEFKSPVYLNEFKTNANKKQIQEVIYEFAIYKICSLFEIGPLIDTDIGFDLLCFNNCIQFTLEICHSFQKIQYYVKDNDHLFKLFEKQLKYNLFQLHSLNIIHKDLKPQNILYSQNLKKFVLTDFGLSHTVLERPGQKSSTYREGTLSYMGIQMFNLGEKKGQIDLYDNDLTALKLILMKRMKIKRQYNDKLPKKKIEQSESYKDFQLQMAMDANKFDSQEKQVEKQQQKNQSQQQQKEVVMSDEQQQFIYNQEEAYQQLKKIIPQIKEIENNKSYKYEYLKLKYLTVKTDQFDEQLFQKYLPCLKESFIIEILENISNSLDYKFIHRIFKYIKLQQSSLKNEKIKKLMEKIHEQSISVRNIEIAYQQNLNKLMLINFIRTYGYNFQTEKIFRFIERRLKDPKQIQKYIQNQKSRIVNPHYYLHQNSNNTKIKFIQNENKKMKKQKNKTKQLYTNLIKLLQLSSHSFQISHVIKDLKSLQYVRTQKEQIFQLIYLFKFDKNSQKSQNLTKIQSIVSDKIMIQKLQETEKINLFLNVGDIYYELQRYNQSLRYYQICHNLEKCLQKSNFQKSIDFKFGLVNLKLNRFSDALLYFNESLILYKQFMSQDNQVIMKHYQSIGKILSSLCKFDEALQYYLKAIKISIKLFGPQHAIIAQYLKNLGKIYLNLNNFETSLNYFTKAIQMYKQIYKQSYYIFIHKIEYDLSDLYFQMQKYNQSLEILKRLLEANLIKYGKRHSKYIKICERIGTIYIKLCKYTQSLIHLNIALKFYEGKESQQNFQALSTIFQKIGIAQLFLQRVQTALENYKKSMSLKQKIYGKHHPYMADSLYNIATIYSKYFITDDAFQFALQSLQINLNYYGQYHISVSNNYNLIGKIYFQKNEYDNSLQNYKKALKIHKLLFKEDESNLQYIYHEIGKLYRWRSQLQKYCSEQSQSLIYLNKSLQLSKNKNNVMLMIDNYFQLGIFYRYRKKFSEAIAFLEKTKQLLNQIEKQRQLKKPQIYFQLALIQKQQHQLDKAKQYFILAIKLIKQYHGQNYILLIEYHYYLGLLYYQMKNLQSAISQFKNSIKLSKINKKYKHNYLLFIFNRLIQINFYQLNQYAEAIKYCRLLFLTQFQVIPNPYVYILKLSQIYQKMIKNQKNQGNIWKLRKQALHFKLIYYQNHLKKYYSLDSNNELNKKQIQQKLINMICQIGITYYRLNLLIQSNFYFNLYQQILKNIPDQLAKQIKNSNKKYSQQLYKKLKAMNYYLKECQDQKQLLNQLNKISNFDKMKLILASKKILKLQQINCAIKFKDAAASANKIIRVCYRSLNCL